MGSLIPIKNESNEHEHSIPAVQIKTENIVVKNEETESKVNIDVSEKHIDRKENSGYTFVCDLCGKRFHKKDTLRVSLTLE